MRVEVTGYEGHGCVATANVLRSPSVNPYAHPHADAYARNTRDANLSPLRDPFLGVVRSRTGASAPRLLEIGSGAGRDLRDFRDAGCEIDAIDASSAMAELSGAYAGVPVRVLRVQELEGEEAFDGIWACASLLHVPRRELPDVFRRLERVLRPRGVLYASFKLGTTERQERALHFTDMDAERLENRVTAGSTLRMMDTWITRDTRPERSELRWLNALLERPASITDAAPRPRPSFD